MNVFADGYGIRPWVIVAIVVFLLGGMATGIALAGGSASCPKGQEYRIVSWIPITVGKIVVISPIWACES